ncbi:outer membrane beta-barrel protein [Haliangium ochraceum]|uniref:Outer membrane protein beta-barrel domain-containing protein n=1 Tax=Haliangium ochraceum (strain DSM 14365 / JCM 11303 / SMP-2) TaxID=502025 RepID=D0LRE3_HALO1|nr:outer membrane beta-barrel protein [Haliangium ochraceum]ACY17171.1 hypothetical protein Hoch_4680 [Haliangium ochraceum DSM 14365]
MKSPILVSSLAASLALMLTGPSLASADEIYVERDVEQRSGFTIGLGLGGGHLECEGEGCDGVTEAGGINVNAGVMLSPNFAIMGDVWAMGHTEDRLTLTHSMLTVGPQVWFGPLWARAGVGAARASFNYDAGIVDVMDETETVPAAMVGAGVEVLSTPEFALDLNLRAGSGFFNDGDTRVQNLSLGVGANWF